MTPRELDEDDVRVRPGRSSRPRTRQRPAHTDARIGLVTAVDRGRWTVEVDGALVTAMRAREMGRRAVVVGDRVGIVGDTTGAPDTLARIVRVEPRRTTLRRSADDTDPTERVVVANAELLVVVQAVREPEPSPRLVDRCLVAAYDGGLEPVLLLTKIDLGSAQTMADAYRPLGVTVLTTARDDDLTEVTAMLTGRTSVLFGPSGVGKSTVINRLVPGALRGTGQVNEVTGRGRHTSSSAVALRLPGGGWVVDTPGVRSLGLALVKTPRVLAAFGDLAEATDACPPGCTHEAGAPRCGLDDPAARLDPVRVDSLRRLLASRSD